MTWFGWLLAADLASSTVYFVAKNADCKPLTPTELTVKVLLHVAYLVGILALGTGALR